VAANDGMLHAFRASDGVELFAYLPGAVITGDGTESSRIARLSDPAYGGNAVPHQYFNDGETTVADAYFGGDWHTVLVGTTGRGPAKAVYALDITDPSSPDLLWERSALDGQTNSDRIGEIVGKPVIAQTADGTWSVLIGNGYNSGQDKAALLRFDLSSGALSVHGTDSSTSNGLAPPAVWMSDAANGISTTAYAGDLLGRVWSFGLTAAGSDGTLLYSAVGGSGTAQPITAGMLAGKDPDTSYLWLFFGTGRYLAQGELADDSVQTWYGIIVQGDGTDFGDAAGSGRGSLRQRQITSETASSDTTLGTRTISAGTDGDMSGKKGWYMDLKVQSQTARGERMVTPNQYQGSLLLGTTRIPESSDPCNPSGSGWIMAVDPFDGTSPDEVFFDVNGDSVFDEDDETNGQPAGGVGFDSVPNNPIFVGNEMLVSFDNATNSSIHTAGTVGALRRLSWRELIAQ
jgi:type IV pilus assembly protein PilY1